MSLRMTFWVILILLFFLSFIEKRKANWIWKGMKRRCKWMQLLTTFFSFPSYCFILAFHSFRSPGFPFYFTLCSCYANFVLSSFLAFISIFRFSFCVSEVNVELMLGSKSFDFALWFLFRTFSLFVRLLVAISLTVGAHVCNRANGEFQWGTPRTKRQGLLNAHTKELWVGVTRIPWHRREVKWNRK